MHSSRWYYNSTRHLARAHTDSGEIPEDDVGDKKGKVQDKIVIAESRIAHQEGETKRTEQETANFRSHVDVHQDGYKKAQNDMPTGMLIPFRAVEFPL